MNKIEQLRQLYTELKARRSQNLSLWQDVSRYVGITVDSNYQDEITVEGKERDNYIDDPTAALSVIQAGDYLDGILWGNGDKVFNIEPADELLRLSDKHTLRDYFDFRTAQLHKHMNHENAGFNRARKPYLYDQFSFGTSAVGLFINDKYRAGIEDNPFVFRNFGVDCMAIDEGVNGAVDTVFITYRWRTNRIYQTFGEQTPEHIKESWRTKDYNKQYTLVQAIYPRENYEPTKKGKLGTKYVGEWFEDNRGDIFYSEDFKEFPCPVCRMMKIRGEVYGISPGTMLISTIKLVNYVMQQGVENVERKNDPALGTFGDAMFGDSVVDTSAGSLMVFNPEYNQGNPLFKAYEEGDPTGMISFLIPYLNEKIATGFKIDVLLDFASSAAQTATESTYRYSIRGKSLAGIITQQKSEMLMPLIKRAIQVEDSLNLKGIDPRVNEEEVKAVKGTDQEGEVIPQAVLQFMEEGKQWYKITFNGELDRLSKSEEVDKIMSFVNGVGMVAQLLPNVLQGVNDYEILEAINEATGNNLIKSKREYEEIMEAIAEQNAQMQQLQGADQASDIIKKLGGKKGIEELST